MTTFSISPFPPQRGATLSRTLIGVFNSNQSVSGLKVTGYVSGNQIYILNEIFPVRGNFTAGQTLNIQDTLVSLLIHQVDFIQWWEDY